MAVKTRVKTSNRYTGKAATRQPTGSRKLSSEEELAFKSLLLDTAIHSVFVHDFDGRMIYVNEAAYKTRGYTREELLDLPLHKLDVPQYADLIKPRMELLLEHGFAVFESAHVKKDGTIMPVEVHCHLTEMGEGKVIASIVRDISERKKAEEALRQVHAELEMRVEQRTSELEKMNDELLNKIAEHKQIEDALRKSEEQYRTLTEAAKDEIYIVDADERVLFVNSFAAGNLGFKPKDIIGKKQSEFFPPRVARRHWRSIKKVLETGKSLYRETAAVFQGREMWLGTRLAPIRDPDGTISAVLGISRDITERKTAEQALKASEERYRKLVELSPDGILVQADGIILFSNRTCAKLLGVRSPKDLVSKPIMSFVHPDHLSTVKKRIRELKRTQKKAPADEQKILRLDGTVFHAEVTASPIDFQNKAAVQVVIHDITERMRFEEALRFESLLLDNATDSVVVHDLDGNVIYVNEAACKMRGYTREEFLSINLFDQVAPEFAERIKPNLESILKKGTASFETVDLKKDGTALPMEIHARVLELEGRKVIASIAHDISERKQAEETIKRMAYYDPLTNLPNRMLFNDRLSVALAHAHRHHEVLCVMFLDLDHFKTINDTLGHAVGDQLLQGIAKRLRGLVREGDTVAHLGGDEFTLLLPQISQEDDVVKIAEKIMGALKPPVHYNGHELHVTTSIGIALYPNDGEDAETLIKNADTAMYRAKEKGRNTYQLYAPAMNATAFERLALETSLRHALDQEEFVINYQPQVDIQTGKIVGMEALLRWEHPDLGMVLPLEFIPVAEDTSLIVPLGEWVLRTACSQAKAWQDAGLAPIRMAVNLSARQFQQQDLTEMVSEVLEKTGLEPRFLELEITESIAMQNAGHTIKTLRDLCEMGVKIAIDDFGTGYSSLSYLKRFPIHTLKIAHSFVRDVSTNSDSAAIATTIIVLARSLKLNAIAEGVETEAQLDFLRKRHCSEMQGYLFSRPLPADEATLLLKEDGRLEPAGSLEALQSDTPPEYSSL